ncbi:hypothetical protein [Prevotella sp. khp7]|uniref:hypothetical protein n=1 Tax=Prevotella sp. khp7 TaxID=1761885 RepID=UPI00115FBDC6
MMYHDYHYRCHHDTAGKHSLLHSSRSNHPRFSGWPPHCPFLHQTFVGILRIHRSYIIAVDKIQKVDRNDCVYIGKEIIHIPDGYLPTFRQFLEIRSMEKR